MIPVHLRIGGFLSYRDQVEIDFQTLDLACISGHNGAGKSALLDAITWSLFGEARKRDEQVINSQSKTAQVVFRFGYEGIEYRVQRTLSRGKNTVLEFQVKAFDKAAEKVSVPGDNAIRNDYQWKPLTERTLKQTQRRIEQILRLDYETFVNASFFLQGKADQFSQQSASKRKEILSSILGFEIWETYKQRTAERRKSLEDQVAGIDGRNSEIEAELAEENQRRSHLKQLEEDLTRMGSARAAQEVSLESMKKMAASLIENRKMVETLAVNLNRSRSALEALSTRLETKTAERITYFELINCADQIETAFRARQMNRAELERWEQVATEIHALEQERAPFLEQIAAEKARLMEENRNLSAAQLSTEGQTKEIAGLQSELAKLHIKLLEAESGMMGRQDFEQRRNAYREKQAELMAENTRLKKEMEDLQVRIERLKVAKSAECPLCGQPLSESHRRDTLRSIEMEGKAKGDQYRGNQADTKTLSDQISLLEKQISALGSAETDRLRISNQISLLTERVRRLEQLAQDWEADGRNRLAELQANLAGGKYALIAQNKVEEINRSLGNRGYDPIAHETCRQTEISTRAAETDYMKLQSARQVLSQLDDEIKNLKSDIHNREHEITEQEPHYQSTRLALEAAQSQSPDPESAERELLLMREQENQMRAEVGAARQKVEILSALRIRQKDYAAQRDSLLLQIAHHKTLERAFGKDGVPALLIEQALPEIETRANELLDRLSEGQMSIRFVTQALYKDKKREDLRETLDILISDPAGVRDYEMFSGGEAFRLNFSIRLALAEVLARRKGARLQTLIIDEGFGSQDMQGRQRLIEAINLVKGDFAKIFVITHLDELKDAFPSRIEVEKGERGSTIRVL